MSGWLGQGPSPIEARQGASRREEGATPDRMPADGHFARDVPPAAAPTGPPARKSGRRLYILGSLLLAAYVLWMLGPYLRSVIVRDATVTTWSHRATSPIDGKLEPTSLAAGQIVGPDGVIVGVRNDRLSRQVLTDAGVRVDLARAAVKELQDFLVGMDQLDDERAGLKSRYADIFRAQLDAEIASLERQSDVTAARIETMRKIEARSEELSRRGAAAEARIDEEQMRLSDLQLESAEQQALLNYAKVRRDAADHSVFMTPAGEDPAWVRGWRLEVKLEKKKGDLDLEKAQAELSQAMAAQDQAAHDFQKLSEGVIGAPPGSVIWSALLAPGSTVRAGTAVAEWIDCSALLVDVPVSDAEVSLIAPGMAANVVLEGERSGRAGAGAADPRIGLDAGAQRPRRGRQGAHPRRRPGPRPALARPGELQGMPGGPGGACRLPGDRADRRRPSPAAALGALRLP